MATSPDPSPNGSHVLKDREGDDIAIYSLTPWDSYEHAWLTARNPKVICWAGDPSPHRKTSGTDAAMLRRVAQLHRLDPAAQATEAVDLALHFGPLGLCVEHGRPLAHLTRPALREVQTALDAVEEDREEDGLWWGLRACQDRPLADGRRTKNVDGKRLVAQVTERLDAWAEWSGIVYGLVAVAWRIQSGRPADADHWRLLQPLLPGSPDHLFRWTANTTEDVEPPLAPRPGLDREDHVDAGRGPLINFAYDGESDATNLVLRSAGVEIHYDLDRPYPEQRQVFKRAWDVESAADLLAAQKRILAVVLDEFLRLADLRLRFDWDHRPAARLMYGGGTLLGAIAAQLSLVIGGVHALAICDYCRDPFVPKTWPRATGDDNVLCNEHRTDAMKAKLRRRTQRAGTIKVTHSPAK